MNSYRRQLMLYTLKVNDLLIVTSWFLIGAVAESHEAMVGLSDFLVMRVKVQNFAIFLMFLLIWHINFSFFGLYQSRRLSPRKKEIVDVLKATMMAVAIVAGAAQMLRIYMVTPLFVVVFWIGSSSTMVLGRILIRTLLVALRKRGRNLRNLLIIGANSRGIHFAEKLESDPELGYQVSGFIDEPGRADTEVFKKSGYRLLASLEDFVVYLRSSVVDEVAVFLPLKSFYLESSRIIALCEEHGIVARVPAQFFNLTLGRAEIEPLEDDTVLTIYTGGMRGLSVAVKRLIDIAISVALLTILFPLLFIVTILVKSTCKGPVFFIQERLGLNKRMFRLFKFRTMIADAENRLNELEDLNEADGPVFKMKHDPRITKLGKLLRKTSIDELPQLINVLKGDMSLVGPRPLPMRDYKGFDEDWERRRFSVRPGITCMCQVNGRSSIPFHKWMELDMEYIDRWSLWLDLMIILKTIPAVLKGVGAW